MRMSHGILIEIELINKGEIPGYSFPIASETLKANQLVQKLSKENILPFYQNWDFSNYDTSSMILAAWLFLPDGQDIRMIRELLSMILNSTRISALSERTSSGIGMDSI